MDTTTLHSRQRVVHVHMHMEELGAFCGIVDYMDHVLFFFELECCAGSISTCVCVASNVSGSTPRAVSVFVVCRSSP